MLEWEHPYVCVGWKIETENIDDMFQFLPTEYTVNDFLDYLSSPEFYDDSKIQKMKEDDGILYNEILSELYETDYFCIDSWNNFFYFGDFWSDFYEWDKEAFFKDMNESFVRAKEHYKFCFNEEPKEEPRVFIISQRW